MVVTTIPRLRVLLRLDQDDPQAVHDLLRLWARHPRDLLRPWAATDFANLLPPVRDHLNAPPQAAGDLEQLVAAWIGTTPLHQAAGASGQSARALTEVLNVLGELPAASTTIDVRDARGYSALSRAVRSDCAARVHALVHARADPSSPYCVPPGGGVNNPAASPVNWSHLRFAASSGRVTALASLLSCGADNVRSGPDGKRPLHIAIEKGRLPCVQTLLAADLVDITADPRRRKALALDRFLVKSASPQFADSAAAASSAESSGTTTSEPTSSADAEDDIDDEEMTHPETSAVSSEWDGADQDDEDAEDEFAISTTGASVFSFAPRRPSAPSGPPPGGVGGTRLQNPFDPALTDANNSVGGVDGLERIIQQAMRHAGVGGTHDVDSVTVAMSMGANRDRGSSLYHLAASYGRARILAYLLDHELLASALPHDVRNEQGKVPIFMAARSGSIACLANFLQRGVDINAVDLENWTVLNEAVKYNRIETVRYILQHGGRVDLADDDLWTPLHVAGRFGVQEAVGMLVQAGGQVNSLTEDNESPLQLACSQSGHLEVMRSLLAHGALGDAGHDIKPLKILADRKDYVMLEGFLAFFVGDMRNERPLDISALTTDGDNFLFQCVFETQPMIIRHMLALGANGNVRDRAGDTLLCAAVRRKELGVVEALLGGGVDVDYPQAAGSRPLHLASDEGWAEGVKLLLAANADKEGSVPRPALHVGFTPLMLAARRGHTGCVRELVRAGALLDAAKRDGYTAVHLSALNGQLESLEVLLAAGANTNLREENDFTALHVSTRNNQLECARALLASGVDVNITGPSALTALHFAAYMTNARMIWLLLTVGADVNARDTDGSTALHVAAGRERGRVAVQMLLTSGAQVEARDNQGDTPLHSAAYRGLYTITRVLLRRGADVNARNDLQLTPLHLASAHGSGNTVRSLLRGGADIWVRAQGGEVAYDLATNGGRKEARVLLFRASGLTLDDLAPQRAYDVESPSPSPAGSMDIGTAAAAQVQGRTICVVCQSALRFGEAVRELPCGHIYRTQCIDQWFGGHQLQEHDKCPLCQKSVLPDRLPER